MLADRLRMGRKAAIQYVGQAINGSNDGNSYTVSLTSLTGGIDTQARAGDLVMVATGVTLESNTPFGPSITTSGYTSTAGQTQTSNGGLYATNAIFGYKTMGGTPDSTVAIAGYGTASNVSPYPLNNAGVFVFRNAQVGTTGSESALTGNYGEAFAPPTVTPQVAGSWVVVTGVANGSNLGNPANMTYYNNAWSIFNSASASPYVLSLGRFAYYSGWTSGSFTPDVWGYTSNSTRTWVAQTLVLRPK